MIRRDPSTSLGTTEHTKRLLLFDIDGTLIHSGGAGVQALKSAFKERFGIDDDLHDIEIAGMTDSGIVLSILNKHRISASNENVSAFLDSYVHFLSLELPRRKGKLLPGVLELLDRLKSRPHVVLALLTGNVSRGAQLKLEHYGVWHFFEFGAFADDHRDRNELGHFARARAKEKHGARVRGVARLTSLATRRATSPAEKLLAHVPSPSQLADGAAMSLPSITLIF